MTDLEQQLKQTYAERLDHLDLTGGDVGAARRSGARMRAKRRLAVGIAAVTVAAVAVGGSLLGTGRVSIGPSQDTGHWRELPAAPLSPRANAQAVWTGEEVVVMGGETQPCPPGADCAVSDQGLHDVAAYNPETNTWRRIESAPVPVVPGDRLLAAGDFVVLRHAQRTGGSSWFVLDPDRNHWLRLRDVPKGIGDLPSVFGSVIYSVAGRRVVSYDVSRAAWSTLPADPITPRLLQRRVTATPYGPVVTGYTSLIGSAFLNRVTADLYDGTAWHRLPPTKIVGTDWAWVGDRMFDFDSFAHQGMDSLPGVELGGQLDPSSGRSGPLPESALETPRDGWSLNASGPAGWAACWGLVYDVRHGQARTLPRPEGAPDYGVSATWTGDRLLAFGGTDFGADGSVGDLTNRAWLWTP
jgi:hypothetical protein